MMNKKRTLCIYRPLSINSICTPAHYTHSFFHVMISTLTKLNRVGNFVFINSEPDGESSVHSQPIHTNYSTSFSYYPLRASTLTRKARLKRLKVKTASDIPIIKVSAVLQLLVFPARRYGFGVFKLTHDPSGYMSTFMGVQRGDLFDEVFARHCCRFKLPPFRLLKRQETMYITCTIPVFIACIPCLKYHGMHDAPGIYGVKIIYISCRQNTVK